MSPLEKVASAVRIEGFAKFASEYVRACGEEPPERWDLGGTFRHLGEKMARQWSYEAEVAAGARAAAAVESGKVASVDDFTVRFHAVNRLANGLEKAASAEGLGELSAQRLDLWWSMKAAAERTSNPVATLAKTAIRVWSETERCGEKTASTRADREGFALAFAANYLVDQKVAAAYEAGEISLGDATKLAHLTAEAAMEDLDGVVKVALGVGDIYVDGGKLHFSQGDTHLRIGDPAKGHEAPFFWEYLPDKYKKDVTFGVDDFTNGRKMWNAGVSIPVDEAKKHPQLAKHLKTAMEKTAVDPRLVGAGIGAGVGAVAGAVSDKDNRWRGAGMGALMGVPVGALGGQIVKELRSIGAPDPEKLRRGQEAFERLQAYANKMGNGVPGLFDKHKDAIVSSFADGRRGMPTPIIDALSPGDYEQLVKLDKTYGGGLFGKLAEGPADPMGAPTGQPMPGQPMPGQPAAPGGGPPAQPQLPLNADAQRKGMAGYQQLVSYGQAIGNGFPELVEQNKDAIIQHFAEGNKHMPPQITATLGPGVIDQVLELKKRFNAPIL